MQEKDRARRGLRHDGGRMRKVEEGKMEREGSLLEMRQWTNASLYQTPIPDAAGAVSEITGPLNSTA